LEVYNVIGQKVETILNCPMESGNYIFEWDGGKYSSGVYFVKFIANGKKSNRSIVFNRKMLLLK